MTEWIDVVAASALAESEHVLIEVDYEPVAVFNLNGQFYAIADRCSHDNNEVASGIIDGDEIICPRHGARFCLKTGQVKCAPAYEDIASYPVRVVDGRLQVKTTN